ncbi:MAG: hypothetical protein C0407_00640 [Desulfobacca sp.]|nr:hypothetical protein [Desulfobacca sp.]
MHQIGLILDSIMLPEAGFFLAFFILFIFLWVILRRLKRFKGTLSILELGHLEFYYQSSEMRSWRLRLINTDRANMKDLQACSQQVLHFFDRLGFLAQNKILSKKEIWQSFGMPIWGYFSLLVPFIQWLRTEERDSDLYVYFEDLNDAVYRLNRKRTNPLMDEEELKRFIEEEKTTLSDS